MYECEVIENLCKEVANGSIPNLTLGSLSLTGLNCVPCGGRQNFLARIASYFHITNVPQHKGGWDIIFQHINYPNVKILVEAKGDSKQYKITLKQLYQAIGEFIFRIQNKANTYYGIAVPEEWGPQVKKAFCNAWGIKLLINGAGLGKVVKQGGKGPFYRQWHVFFVGSGSVKSCTFNQLYNCTC